MSVRPLLVLLHGTRLSGAQWATYAERLADIADVVAPDLPAHGKLADQPFTMAGAVQLVSDTLAGAGKRPIFLVGHSLGGFVAMSYTEQHPTHLSGLVLIGSATEPSGPGAIVYKSLAHAWNLLGPERLQRLDSGFLQRIIHPDIWAAIREDGQYYHGVDATWSEVMQNCSSRQLREVACPVLVLGGRWDQIHLQARRFAAAAPHGKVITAPGRSHAWPMTHPDEVARHLRRWMAQLQLAHGGADTGATISGSDHPTMAPE